MRPRQWTHWAIRAVLIVAIIAQAAYLARRPLFEGLLRDRIAIELGALLDAEVELGAITGSWIRDVAIDGIQIRGERATLRVTDGELAARFSPWKLASGDFSGLDSVWIRAARAEIEPAEPSAEPSGSGQPIDTDAIGHELQTLLQAGVGVDIAELSIDAGELQRRGRFAARLQPGRGDRDLSLEFGTDRVGVAWRPQRGWSARGRIEQPGQLLRDLGIDQPVGDGCLGFRARLRQRPLRIDARAELVGGKFADSPIEACRIAAAIDHHTLRSTHADISVPGLRAHAQSLAIPSPWSGAPDLRALRGDARIELRDFDGDWLPAEARVHAPLSGRLEATCRDGILRLGRSSLQMKTASVRVESGALPIVADPAQMIGEIRFTAKIASPTEFGPVTLAGNVGGTVAGSLTQPRVHVDIDTTDLQIDGEPIDAARAHVEYADRRLEITNLDARRGGATLTGAVTVEFESEREPAKIRAEVDGSVDADLLRRFSLELPTDLAMTAPVAVAVDGNLTLTDPPTAAASIAVRDMQLGDLPTMTATGELSLLADRVAIETLRVSGPSELQVHGTIPLDQHAPLRLDVDARALRVELLPLDQDLRGTVDARAQLSGTLGAPTAQVDVHGQLDEFFTTHPQSWPVGTAPNGPLQFSIAASHDADGIRVRRLSTSAGDERRGFGIDAAGSIPLRWNADRGLHAIDSGDSASPPLRGHAVLRVPDPRDPTLPASLGFDWTLLRERVELADIRLLTSDSFARGTATLAAGAAQIPDPQAWTEAAVDVTLGLEGVRLEAWLPKTVTGLPLLTGRLTGKASVGGTVREPTPRIDAQLEDGSLKIAGLPRLESATGRIAVTDRRIEVERLEAEMGAGFVRLSGSAQSDGAPLWTLPDDTRVDVTLEGKEALLVRGGGVKLRGDAALRLTGTPAELLVGGTFTVTSGKFVRRQTLLPDLRARGGATGSTDFVPFRIPPPLGERLRFDVRVETDEPFEIATHVFDSSLNGSLRLLGPGVQPYFQGSISGTGGKLRLPGATLEVQSVLISASESHPLSPELRVRAEGRRHGVRVSLQVRGRYPDFEVQLSSVPNLTRDDILVLLSTGVLPDRLRDASPQERAQLLASYLAGELVALYYGSDSTERGKGFADRFEIEYGSEISKNGLESVVVEFTLLDFLALRAERDVYEDYNMGIVLRFRF